MQYRIKEPDIVYDNFENEVVLINLENGNYYSIQGSAAEIWGHLAKGMSVKKIVHHLLQNYQGDPEEVTQSVRKFLTQLSEDALIEPVTQEGPPYEPDTSPTDPASVSKTQPAFEPPKLERYTDMQALLLLDPIHDVGEEGWPNQNPDQTSESDKST